MTRYIDIRPGGGDTSAPLNQKKRIGLIRQFVSIQGKKVLDCGCGTGQYVAGLLAAGADAWGIEYSDMKVQEFHRRHPEIAARVSQGNAERMEFPDCSFDIVLVNEVLEHITNESKALGEVKRILRPGGICFVFSPNRLYPFETHGVFLKAGRKRVPHWVPFIPYIPLRLGYLIFDYPARNYWPYELRRLVRSQGFIITHTGYLWQTFENISGRQPAILGRMRPHLRKLADSLEGLPLVRILGVSQVLIAINP